MSRVASTSLVVGAGPAEHRRTGAGPAGARVALLDKARFPRDKACGDFIGPRGLQLLADLGVAEPPGLDVGDMVVVGPTGRRVVLPCFDGTTYPGRARAVTRAVFDDALRAAALDAGAEGSGRQARADGDCRVGWPRRGPWVRRGHRWRAAPADGPTSSSVPTGRPATWPSVPGLVDDPRCWWGFAVRCYVDQRVDLPAITLWERAAVAGLPRVRMDLPRTGRRGQRGTRDRHPRRPPVRCHGGAGRCRLYPVPWWTGWACSTASRPRPAPPPGGLAQDGDGGTSGGRPGPAGRGRGRLVNPLQGEGIAQAMTSGRAAAEAVWARPGRAPRPLPRAIWPAPISRISGSRRPAMPPGRPATCRRRRRPAAHRRRWSAGPWPADGGSSGTSCSTGPPGAARRVASASTGLGPAVTGRTEVSRWFDATFGTEWS